MNQLIKLPQSWGQVKVYQFKELVKLNNESFINKTIETILILSEEDLDMDVVDEMDVIELNTMVKNLKYLNSQPSTSVFEEIGEYKLINLYNISLRHFMDLEYLFKNDYFENIGLIAALMYMKPNDEFGSYNIYERASYFEALPITAIYGMYNHFNEFKKVFTESYRVLFTSNEPEEEDEEEIEYRKNMSAEDKIELEKEIQAEAFHAKWAWEKVVHKLADGDFTKKPLVYGRGLIECFDELLFLKENNL